MKHAVMGFVSAILVGVIMFGPFHYLTKSEWETIQTLRKLDNFLKERQKDAK